MSLFATKSILHHFKICFPLPLEKVQNCLKKIQNLNRETASAVCISFNGLSETPQNCQLLYDSLLSARQTNRISVYTFLQDKATSLAYYTATAGQKITANPYSIIGDIGTVQKSYRNIKKLLDLVGFKYEELGSKQESTRIWNQFVEKSERQKQFTNKWLDLVENNLINSIHQRRNIPKNDLISIRNRIYHPRDALALKLVDSVSTFEEFLDLNYPNTRVENYVYRIDGQRIGHNLAQKEISTISNFLDVLQMPQVALLSTTEPLTEAVRQLFGLIEARLMGEQGIDGFEEWLGAMFSRLESMGGKELSGGLMFEL